MRLGVEPHLQKLADIIEDASAPQHRLDNAAEVVILHFTPPTNNSVFYDIKPQRLSCLQSVFVHTQTHTFQPSHACCVHYTS